MEKIVDQSIITRKNAYTISFSVIMLVAMIGFSVYRYFDIGFWSPLEIFAELMIIFVLIDRAQSKITYELDKKVFRITKKSLLGTQVYEIPYKDVFGIYDYRPKLVGAVKFRHTYRLHSALDGRKVWTLAYRVMKKGKTENRKVFFKASEELLNGLNQRLPNKVRISEEETVKNIILNEKD